MSYLARQYTSKRNSKRHLVIAIRLAHLVVELLGQSLQTLQSSLSSLLRLRQIHDNARA